MGRMKMQQYFSDSLNQVISNLKAVKKLQSADDKTTRERVRALLQDVDSELSMIAQELFPQE